MSHLSDPDRLERQAHYLEHGEALIPEVVDALRDAAERIRSLHAREAAARPVIDAADAIVVGSRVTGLTLSDDTHHRAALVAAIRARREANQ